MLLLIQQEPVACSRPAKLAVLTQHQQMVPFILGIPCLQPDTMHAKHYNSGPITPEAQPTCYQMTQFNGLQQVHPWGQIAANAAGPLQQIYLQ